MFLYIMSRRVFLKAGLGDRGMADYVVSLLAEFIAMARVRRQHGDRPPAMEYLTDMANVFFGHGQSYAVLRLGYA